MNKKAIITVVENGPYIVQNLDIIENYKGEAFDAKPVMALCRCGASNNKPYCDGAHVDINFQEKNREANAPKKIKKYVGKKITVNFDLSICAHAAICLNTLPSVFDLKCRPWVNAEGAKPEMIMATINKCPSGALSYEINDDTNDASTANNDENCHSSKITVIKNGPLNVEGNVELQGHITCRPSNDKQFCLCRCGHSKNAPFCDGSHFREHFRAE
jgi:CDGSH-type Zn-finger protein/ferredoxin